MRYLKTYEQSINEEPKIGDYVVVGKHNDDVDWTKFPFKKLLNQIGIITRHDSDKEVYLVEFPSIEWYFYKEHIEFFSKDKEDAKIYLSSKKYNL